jgi:hypothetical protein
MAYVYRHIRLDKNEPFYIGIACNKRNDYVRAYEKSRRSDWWKKIVLKTDYRVEIIIDDVSPDFAKEKEKEFIQLYGRRDLKTGSLVNMTNGGDGMINLIFTKQHRERLSISAKKRIVTEEQKIKLRQSRIGRKLSQEHKDKISQYMKRYIATDSLRAFRSDRMLKNNPSKGKLGVNSKGFKGYIAAYKNGFLYGIYEGVYDAARNLNNSPTNINRCITGKGKTSKGYTYKRIASKDMA